MVQHLGFQILLEAVRAFLLFQSSKPRNETGTYVCDHRYEAVLGEKNYFNFRTATTDGCFESTIRN